MLSSIAFFAARSIAASSSSLLLLAAGVVLYEVSVVAAADGRAMGVLFLSDIDFTSTVSESIGSILLSLCDDFAVDLELTDSSSPRSMKDKSPADNNEVC